jgi:MoxR-like ATPase
MKDMIRFVGDGQPHADTICPDSWTLPEPYVAPPSLVEAVNVALYLRRPLLLEGDPGCGKTRLAYAVAYELGYPIKECYVRSTSRAEDFLYQYDGLKRLYDVQVTQALHSGSFARAHQHKRELTHSHYVTLSSLGQAIKLSQANIPSVVLIDEIDKADPDFPNDLLDYLEQLRFSVKEDPSMHYDALQGKQRQERRDQLPLFIITSNREKELPKAFLRRCLFYYIDFPDQSELQKIIERHFGKQDLTPLFVAAVKRFWQLRAVDFTWRKPPSTSELLDWVQILEQDEQRGKITADQLEQATLKTLPHLETLVKTQSDRNALFEDEVVTALDEH